MVDSGRRRKADEATGAGGESSQCTNITHHALSLPVAVARAVSFYKNFQALVTDANVLQLRLSGCICFPDRYSPGKAFISKRFT